MDKGAGFAALKQRTPARVTRTLLELMVSIMALSLLAGFAGQDETLAVAGGEAPTF